MLNVSLWAFGVGRVPKQSGLFFWKSFGFINLKIQFFSFFF